MITGEALLCESKMLQQFIPLEGEFKGKIYRRRFRTGRWVIAHHISDYAGRGIDFPKFTRVLLLEQDKTPMPQDW